MSDEKPQPSPPPRAFAQGVGTVLQFVGGSLFLAMMFICCGSGLISKQWATQPELQRAGWRLGSSGSETANYSVQRAITISLFVAIFLGLALAVSGLGLQAHYPTAARGAVLLSAFGALFWLMQTIFFVQHVHSIYLKFISAVLTILFAALLPLTVSALREMRANPPSAGHEVLPADFKIPYSHYHPDPPEVRLAAELEQRRRRIALQQKELELMEEKLRLKLREKEEHE